MKSKEIIGNHFPDKLQRSTVSPWGENKRGEFLHLAPPPNSRQQGISSDFTSVFFFSYTLSDFMKRTISFDDNKEPITHLQCWATNLPYLLSSIITEANQF
ncbi:MAG: hypothetical protein K9H64_16200 [Bacteroidales bacterium]|nr:hypothetical protein [Bacteroidales bacterium]MCF8457511.1 hypothetical protein [Bacteroidales bacterium]